MSQISYGCDICGEDFISGRERRGPKHCRVCAEWLRSLGKGPFQTWAVDYEKLGMVIGYLVGTGKLGVEDFIAGVVSGIRQSQRSSVGRAAVS